MAIQKKKATSVVQKSKSKNVAPKKATSAKKAEPVKKPVTKKARPVKKVAVKKPAAKKATPVKKASVSKKATPAKKTVIAKTALKKQVPAKKTASKLKSASAKKPISIKKSSPVKNAAKTGAKKAVINKLATPKKSAEKNKETIVKKSAVKELKKPAAKSNKEKSIATASEPDTITRHKAELKKALSKVKAKEKQRKKADKPFVMPKTTTDRTRKYEPEFIKSVLDPSPEEYAGPTMRYSDNELVEFRELIERKLETAKKELGYLQGLITRKDQMGGDDTDNRYMTMEDGGLSMEREQLSQMASRQITFIDHLEKAMMRIENKTYGICRVTGKLIDKARLRAVPHATLSIEAKMGR